MSIRQFFVGLGDLSYYKTLEKELNKMTSVLDVGCGSWSPLIHIKKTFRSVGVDIYKPSIEEIKKKKIHDEYKIGNVLKIYTYFKPKSFDAVVALDVVEHFEEKEGNYTYSFWLYSSTSYGWESLPRTQIGMVCT